MLHGIEIIDRKACDSMFRDPGGKIKILANILFILSVVAALFAGFSMLTSGLVWVGLGTIAGGVIGGWVSNLLLYGFGELIENSIFTVAFLSDKK